jgi:transposase
MMGQLKHEQEQLFYAFRLDEVVPSDHLVREIAAVLDLTWVRAELASYYSPLGRPSIDPVLMIRMLIVGYVFAIRSERLLCREVQVNLAYRWFCGLSIEDKIPAHSAFSRARNERFRNSDLFRRVFERVVEACIAAGLVGGEGFAVDASLIVADANKQRSIPGSEWQKTRDPETASRAVKEYLATLDDAAFGAASEVRSKFRLAVRPGCPMDRRDARTGLFRLRRQLSRRCEVRSDRRRRGLARHSSGGGRCGEDDDQAYRGTLRPEARASCGGHGLWIGRDAPLDRERTLKIRSNGRR